MGLTKPCGFDENPKPTELSSVGRLIVSTIKAVLCARESQKSWALAFSSTGIIKSMRVRRKRRHRHATNDTFSGVHTIGSYVGKRDGCFRRKQLLPRWPVDAEETD